MLVHHIQRWLAVLAFAGTASLVAIPPASSQYIQRQIPDDAKRATIVHVSGMMVTLDGKQVLISAGGLIRNQNNLIIVPSALPREGSLAEYLLDANGQLTRAWLLTPQEAARKKTPPAKP